MPPVRLTDRQEQVLLLVGDMLTNRQIGEVLGITDESVFRHVAACRERLGARSKRELVPLARRYFGGPGPVRL